jgi:hypothetical protein
VASLLPGLFFSYFCLTGAGARVKIVCHHKPEKKMFIDLKRSGVNFTSIFEIAEYINRIAANTGDIVYCEFEGIMVKSAEGDRRHDAFLVVEAFFNDKINQKDEVIKRYNHAALAMFNLILNHDPVYFEKLGYPRDDIQRLLKQSWRTEDIAKAKSFIESCFK